MSKKTLFIRPETIDHLGRVVPGVTLDSVTCGIPTPRGVSEALAQAAQNEQYQAYDEVVRWAWSHGVTRGPEDLAGRRCTFALCR